MLQRITSGLDKGELLLRLLHIDLLKLEPNCKDTKDALVITDLFTKYH